MIVAKATILELFKKNAESAHIAYLQVKEDPDIANKYQALRLRARIASQLMDEVLLRATKMEEDHYNNMSIIDKVAHHQKELRYLNSLGEFED